LCCFDTKRREARESGAAECETHQRNLPIDWNSDADSDRIAQGSLLAESSTKPRIVVGSDHAGFGAKENIKKYLEGAGYLVDDVGTQSEEPVDYPDFAPAAGERKTDQWTLKFHCK
jgi:hypothetical protein